jgi:pimeloyl-ACP methyl ester carboxylesterase
MKIAFAHANSYPAGCYRALFAALAPEHEVIAPAKFGHDKRFPVADGWHNLVLEYETWLAGQGDEPLLLLGHSLGGYLSLMTACHLSSKLPGTRIKGLILLDAPLVGGRQAYSIWMAKQMGLIWTVPPASLAKSRREHFASPADAFGHFRGKKVFAEFSDAALQDYIDAGLEPNPVSHEPAAAWRLSFNRRTETRIYASLPHRMPQIAEQLRRAAPTLPVGFVHASRSREMKMVGLTHVRKLVPDEWIRQIDGTHLFPLEKPVETATVIKELVGEMGAD